MAWNWPVISGVRKKLFPDKEPEVPPTPTPAVDDVTPETKPEQPTMPEPGLLNSVNYIRAWLILRNTPFKELRAEFLKLPLKKLAYVGGLIVWAYMTYTLTGQLIAWLQK